MKKYIIIGLIALVGIAFLIQPLLNNDPKNIEVDADNLPAKFVFQDNLATIGDQQVDLSIEVTESVERIELLYNDSLLQSWDKPAKTVMFKLNAGMFGVGTRTLNLISVKKDGRSFVDNRMVRVLSDIVPEKKVAVSIESFPHNPTSFTQGLEFDGDVLYEGTGDPGNKGKTIVASVDLNSGKQLKTMGLSAGFFGEGITILDGVLYQLTWQNQRCYKYDVNDDLRLLGEYSYTGEGWGLCNDGSQLIMSNGTERITFRNPQTFEITRTIDVYNNQGPINYLNELEFIDGKIYANVWTTNMVVIIDPLSGKVLEEVDCTSLLQKGQGAGEVLNGIAFNKRTGKMYMTGKYWSRLLEVKFVTPGV